MKDNSEALKKRELGGKNFQVHIVLKDTFICLNTVSMHGV